MPDMVNPYIAGAPVTEARMFFGREDVFEWIQNSLTGRYADHILVIHGQRRVGKTSVLKQLGNRLPKRYIPVFFDLQGRTHTTLDRFLWWLAREIARVLKQDRGLEIPVPEEEIFTRDVEFFESQFLPSLRSLLGERTLLLTFDEFDNLEEREIKEELARPLIDYLRRMMGQEGLNFIFSIGSSGRKLENMQAAYTEFFKTALYKKISFLNEEQTHNLVTRPVEGVLEYERAAVDEIFQTAFGHPYFTQLMCHELFARCQRTEQRKIAKADVEAILDDVVERGTVNLKFVWDEASDIEKWSLAALAQLDKTDPRAVADYLRKNRVRFSETDLTSGLLHLREKDVLTSENSFVIHLLKLWLQKNRPIEQAREELTEVNPIANRYIEIGLEFKDARVYDKAIESFQEALAIAKDNVQAQVNIALTYMDQKMYDKAVVEFEKALAMDDEDISARAGLCEAQLALGDAAREKGRTREAIQSYQKVLDINAEHTEARGRMAEIQRQRAEKALADGRDEEALAAFSEALKFTPEDEALAKRYEQAKVEKRTKVIASLLAKAEKEQSARNWDGALSILNQADEIDPGNENVQKRLATVKEEKHKAQLDALLARADRARQAGRWGLVIAALEEYLEAEPADSKVRERLEIARQKQTEIQIDEMQTKARSLCRQERFEEALAAWQEVLKIAPVQAQAVQSEIEKVQQAQGLAKSYTEGQTAFTKKNYDKAVTLLKSVIDLDVNYKDASRLFAQAVELRRMARKWWQSRWLWGSVSSAIILVVAWWAFRTGSPLMTALLATPTTTGEATQLPPISTVIPIFTVTSFPTATAAPLPYRWARLNSGQFLPRDPITAIVIDPNDAGVMYIATQNAGIYKSIDGGISWQPIHNGLGRAEVYSLIMDPRDSKILYAGTFLGGVYKTTDGGLTWHAMNEGIDIQMSGWVAIIVMDAQNSQHLYFTHTNTIYETQNGGLSWQTVKDYQGSCPNNFVGLVSDPYYGKPLYTADWGGAYGGNSCQGGVYKSTDEGLTWTITNFQSQPQEIRWNALWIEPTAGQTLYISSAGRLWVSNDKGETWTESNPNGCNAMVFDTQDPLTAYCGNKDQIMKTTDGGRQWRTIANPAIGDPNVLAISPQDRDTLFIGASGLFTSTDGGVTWILQGSGLSGGRFDLKLYPQNSSTMYVEDTACRLYRSTDGGRNWEFITDQGCGLTFDVGGELMYRSGWDVFLSSNDAGNTWTKSLFPQPIHSVVAHPAIPGRVYAICEKDVPSCIYVSLDYGQTWHKSTGINKIVDGGMFFSDSSEQRLYVASGNNQFYASDDFGESWKEFDNGAVLANSETTRLVIDPFESGHLYIATQGKGVLVSTDGGQNWQESRNGLGSQFVNTIAIDPKNPDTLYAGTDDGAYTSTDGGENWRQINDGLLGATVVYSIVVDPQSSVYAATPYGIFRLEGR